ncbi:MAG: prolyl aminopeptidase [Vampirovibrio sp.]|nr:prolyl aminopeptidase [Vampirovibrio sp.]
MKTLYPEIEPYNTFRLQVSDIHNLYVEEAGNPDGLPVIFLHGGPGGGISERNRRLFNPAHYRIVLFDQRGSGQSTPHACLDENTTWDLVADIERIREHLNIENWLVYGGSWGSTLGLAYAQQHPDRTTGLILRGIFLCRPEEIQWFYQEGCSWIYPEVWEKFEAQVPVDQRHDMVTAYYKLLTHQGKQTQLNAAKAWSGWEGSAYRLIPDPNDIAEFEMDDKALSIARLECHYFVNNCFFREDNQLLANAHKIQHIPTWIVHGRYDVICPTKNAWDLHKALPDSKYSLIPDAGHSYKDSGMLHALITATEEYAALKGIPAAAH